MATPTVLYGKDGRPLGTETHPLFGEGEILCVISPEKARSVWVRKAWAAAAENVRIATPKGSGTLEILDMVLTAEKKQGGSILVRFNDGSDTDNVLGGSTDDSSINMSMSFNGKVQGWKNAYLEYTVVGAWIGAILVTYVHHIKAGKTYSKWNAER